MPRRGTAVAAALVLPLVTGRGGSTRRASTPIRVAFDTWLRLFDSGTCVSARASALQPVRRFRGISRPEHRPRR